MANRAPGLADRRRRNADEPGERRVSAASFSRWDEISLRNSRRFWCNSSNPRPGRTVKCPGSKSWFNGCEESGMTDRDLLPGYAFTPDSQSIVVGFGGNMDKLNVTTGEDRTIAFQATVSRELGPKLTFRVGWQRARSGRRNSAVPGRGGITRRHGHPVSALGHL